MKIFAEVKFLIFKKFIQSYYKGTISLFQKIVQEI